MHEETITLIYYIVNFVVLAAVITGIAIFIKKMKFSDKNNRLLFVLYMLFWISPIICRDFTASMHIHLRAGDGGMLLWIPIMSYGLITLLWRPLNDLFTYRLKSRKTVIYISLAIQIFCLLPVLIYPSFFTNVIQSAGAGVGAAGIGLFNLMFNEKEKHSKKQFLTVSLFALPPIFAGLLVPPIETLVSNFVPSIHTSYQYVNNIWFIFFIAIILITACIILTSFISENKTNLYQRDKYKAPVKTGREHVAFILICIVGALAFCIKWATSGETSALQLAYIGLNDGEFTHSTVMVENYLGLVYAIGALVGTILAGVWLNKTKNTSLAQILLMLIASVISIGYSALTATLVNTYAFFFGNILNGLAYGFYWTVLVGLAINKVFVRTSKITPIGVFNASLSIGVIAGSVLVGLTKGPIFDVHGGWGTYTYQDFLKANKLISYICLGMAVAMFGLYLISHFIYVSNGHKSTRIKVKKQFVNQSDADV